MSARGYMIHYHDVRVDKEGLECHQMHAATTHFPSTMPLLDQSKMQGCMCNEAVAADVITLYSPAAAPPGYRQSRPFRRG
jgi:hypothetical protein